MSATSGNYFLMGDTVSDRTNRITLIKLVAQKLDIDRTGQVDFYLLNDDIVIKKGEGEYDPKSKKSGFFMGSSIVDKDNRITIIKLVVQNLQIEEGNKIEFFLHYDEVVLRKANEKLINYNPEETSEKCHEVAAWICVNYTSKMTDHFIKSGRWPDEETILRYMTETAKEADMSKLTKEDRERLGHEVIYLLESMSNNPELALEYNHKYSEEYKKSAKRLEELEMLMKGFTPDPYKGDEESFYEPPITMPKKSVIRKLFSKRA